jgi:glycosyltransferase involved in cell wall biosynthesis
VRLEPIRRALPERPSISFFFPACNEEETVEALTRKAVETLPTLTDDWEVIIVNDGSTDRTGEIADRLAREIPRVRVVHHPVNAGYGRALRSGFAESRKDLVFYTDGDLQFDVAEMALLVPKIREADIVSGFKLRRADDASRRIVSFVYNSLLRVFFGLRVTDVNCGFKLYRREIFDVIDLKSTRGLIDAEVLLKAEAVGFTITQVGVHHYPRTHGSSRYRVREIALTIVQMLTLWMDLRLGRGIRKANADSTPPARRAAGNRS